MRVPRNLHPTWGPKVELAQGTPSPRAHPRSQPRSRSRASSGRTPHAGRRVDSGYETSQNTAQVPRWDSSTMFSEALCRQLPESRRKVPSEHLRKSYPHL
jgi:hypothetical protein